MIFLPQQLHLLSYTAIVSAFAFFDLNNNMISSSEYFFRGVLSPQLMCIIILSELLSNKAEAIKKTLRFA